MDHVVLPDEAESTVEPAGRFRLYLGAAAGVGKTCAMLDEGQRRRQRGTDIVAALVETHGRPRTQELAAGLEVVPRKVVEYRGSRFEEMDLEAVLARKPEVALVDELAHTNVPGSGPHEKRWQDVMTLLEAGISVVSTVNIQHLESLADAVERITGVAVRERVPDWVVREADQLELIDSSPEQLRRRMIHGNIYPRQKVPEALSHFFRPENLTALRELALRFVADETEDELLEYLSQVQPDQVWETTERFMAAVSDAEWTEGVLRRAARMAARSKADLLAVHVRASDSMRQTDEKALAHLRSLAADLGARWFEVKADESTQALVNFARSHQVTQIVLGSSRRSRWEELTRGSIVTRLLRAAAESGLDVHIIARRELEPAPRP